MSKLLTAENLLSSFPSSLSEDEQQYALATVMATELLEMYEKHDMLAIYARIDEIDESLLDILAHDFKVDWWDGNASLLAKRDTFKNCWEVHRIKGTPLAVDLFLTSIYKNVTIKEWFEYGGEPFHYKLDLPIDFDDKSISKENIGLFFRLLGTVKNVRSILDEFTIATTMPRISVYYGFAPMIESGYEVIRTGEPEASIDLSMTQYIGTAMIDTGFETININE